MDSEFKKLLAGESWAETGDRVDMNDPSIQPTIDRGEGYPIDFSTDTAPARSRINQILRELTGAAKEVVRGVSAYDAEVDYPQGSICQANGDMYYAVSAHDASSPVNPLTLGQTTWATIAGRSASERTKPAEIPTANIFIDGDRADRFDVWWFPPDTGGHPILQTQIRYSKDINFTGVTPSTVVPGQSISIAARDSDLYYVALRARNTLGWGPWSAAKRVRNTPVSPGSVTQMILENSGTAGYLFTRWARPEDNGLNITQFRIQWARTDPPAESFSTTERNRLITVTDQTKGSYDEYLPRFGDTANILPDAFHDVRIQAISNRGTVSPGGRVSNALPTGNNRAPAAPRLSAEAVSATRSRVWINNVFDDGGLNVLDYRWYYRVIGSGSDYTQENTTTQSLILKHDRGVRYEVRVRVRNMIGQGGFSQTVEVPAFTPSRPEPPAITVQSSTTAVADALKGVVSFSMGNMSTPEVVKDRIIQTAVRWTPVGGSNWTELEGTSYPTLTDNNFSVRQVFPASGNLTLDQALDVQARWRNAGGWSDWTDSIELGAVTAPSGALVLSKTQTTIQEGGSGIINVSLSRQPIEDTTVTITSSNTDLTISPATLTFTESNWGTAQSITLSTIVDADLINDIAIVTLRTTGGLNVSDDTIAVTIQEPVRMIANWADGPIDIPEGGTGSLIIGLTGEPASNVNVTISKTGSDDITLNASSLTFTPANWKTQQVVTVSAATDADGDPDSANITIQATGGVSATLTREVNVTDGVTRVELMVGPEQGASIGAGLSRTFTIRPESVPAAGFDLNILPVNPNHVSVSPSTMRFTRTNWDTAQTLTVSIPSTTPAGLNEWITLEPANAPDVQSHEIELVTTTALVENGSRSAYIIPEGNRILPVPTNSLTNIGVKMNGNWPGGNTITITPSSANPDLSFETIHNSISTITQLSQFVIRSALDSDIVSENIPVVYTASGGFTGSLSVPTMVLESTNTLRTEFVNNGVNTVSYHVGHNGVRGTVGVRLLNEPPAGSDIRVRIIRVSGATPNVTGTYVNDEDDVNMSVDYNTNKFIYFVFENRNSWDEGDEMAVYDLVPRSANTSVSIPAVRVRFVRGAG